MGGTSKTLPSLKLVVGEKGVLNSQVVVPKYLGGQKIPQSCIMGRPWLSKCN
jgi:hypothetical protein